MFFWGNPADSTELQVYGSPSISTHIFTGKVGQNTSNTLGFHLTQGIQGTQWGGYLRLGSELILVEQTPPPFIRHMRTYSVGGGMRYGVKKNSFRYFTGFELSRLFLLSNGLVSTTGAFAALNGLGVHVAIRWEENLPIFIEIEANSYAYFFAETPFLSTGLMISIGFMEHL